MVQLSWKVKALKNTKNEALYIPLYLVGKQKKSFIPSDRQIRKHLLIRLKQIQLPEDFTRHRRIKNKHCQSWWCLFFCKEKTQQKSSTEFSQQRYKDSNLEMTESESVALPFGDSAIFCCFTELSSQQWLVYNNRIKNASIFFNFFKIF